MYDVHVRFVDEDALPEAQTWVIGATADGQRFLFVKEGAAMPCVIEDAWRAGFRLNVPTLRVAV